MCRLEVAGEAVHLADAEEFGQATGQDDAVLQRIAEPGGRLGAIAQHPPATLGIAAEVGGVGVQIGAVAGLDPVAGAKEVRIAVDQRRR